jgi:hypothetical protein
LTDYSNFYFFQKKNNRFYRLYRIFGFFTEYSVFGDRLFKFLFFSEKITDFTDYTEYSVFLPNIRPNIRFWPIIQIFIFFRKNNRFYRLYRIFGFFTEYSVFGFDRLFKFLFFSEKITDFTDYTEYSVFLPNIRPNIRWPIIQIFIFFRKNNRFYRLYRIFGFFTEYSVFLPNIRFFYRIFGFDRLFKFLFFSEKITDFTDYTEYSVFLPNIRPNIRFWPIIQIFIFFRKNNRFYRLYRIFGFFTEYSAEYSVLSDYSNFYFFQKK